MHAPPRCMRRRAQTRRRGRRCIRQRPRPPPPLSGSPPAETRSRRAAPFSPIQRRSSMAGHPLKSGPLPLRQVRPGGGSGNRKSRAPSRLISRHDVHAKPVRHAPAGWHDLHQRSGFIGTGWALLLNFSGQRGDLPGSGQCGLRQQAVARHPCFSGISWQASFRSPGAGLRRHRMRGQPGGSSSRGDAPHPVQDWRLVHIPLSRQRILTPSFCGGSP